MAEHSFRKIERDLKSDAFAGARVVLFVGAEGLLAETYERRLRERFVMAAAETLDYARLDGEEVMADDIILACDTLPMMSERRVVSVLHMHGDEKSLASVSAKTLASYINDIPSQTLLIITAQTFSKRSALYKQIEKAGLVYAFDRLERGDVSAFIKGRFRRAGLDAPGGVINEILSVSGYLERDSESDLYELDSAVRQIASYAAGVGGAGATGQVTMADVAACMGTSTETNVFALLDAVSAGRKGDAIELVLNITARDENTFGLIALLTGQFEIMLGYREMKEQKKSIPEIAKALNIKSEWRLRKAAGFADKYQVRRLMELLDRLYRVDTDIKSGLYKEGLALTMFVAEM
ncbi:MAG: DNA polymerase III subunit delta [Clostridiales Family XIII bacterium]|jgi:DNA polymerase-3 subunit delta|nr:DNA polymerase III subunit delta [Clostridiales Family XIII bacterium]